MPQPRPVALRAALRTISGSTAWRSCRASLAESTARRTTEHSTPVRSRSIAGGIDVFYPPENQERQKAISEQGLVLAEMPPGTEPRARHFPYRNRIIAGLSTGTVVVEAAPRSGSLITARLAAEAGREVMAVPGSPLDPRAQGCNQLIRDGATLVQNADDVIEASVCRATAGPLASPIRRPPSR